MKKLNLLLAVAGLAMLVVPQKSGALTVNEVKYYNSCVNKKNAVGKKEGFWIEKDGNWRSEYYYKNGVKSGVYKQYAGDGSLSVLGFYKDGLLSGPVYRFLNDGHLVEILKDFTPNTFSATIEGKKFTPPYKCYYTSFHPNGLVKEEGIFLFGAKNNPWDDSVEYGEWKYYDETGKLTETKTFK